MRTQESFFWQGLSDTQVNYGQFCCKKNGKIERKCPIMTKLSCQIGEEEGALNLCLLDKFAHKKRKVSHKDDRDLDGVAPPAKRKGYSDFASKNKTTINEKFSLLCQNVIQDDERVFLVLDGPKQRTAKKIVEKFGILTTIYSPQLDKNDYKQMDQTLATVTLGSVSEFLQTKDAGKANCLFLDYMGSPEGNEGLRLYPFTDIYDYLIKARPFHKKIALAVTFSRRLHDIPENTTPFYGSDGMGVTQYQLAALSEYCGYKIKFREIVKYKRTANSTSMITFLLELTKIAPKPPEKCKPFLFSNHGIYSARLGLAGRVQKKRFWGFDPEIDDSWIDIKP